MAKQLLDGVKVIDFTWALAGPCGTKILADQGATVIKIESMSAVDLTRTAFPMARGVRGINRCGYFSIYSNNKLSMGLNLRTEKGREIMKRLITWADVVTENFMPTTLEKWGLGYDDMKKINEDIILLRSSMHGQTGPTAVRPGWGTMLQAECGFFHFLGYPDGEPLAHVGYTDYTAPWYTAIAVMGALNYRDRTGKGMLLDLSQFETGVNFLGPLLLEYTANKRDVSRMGNRDLNAAPHGIFRCLGDDRWCAITVSINEEWRTLAQVMNQPELADDSRFCNFQARKQHEAELETIIESWTINIPPEEVMTRLQAAGVAAGVVQNGADLDEDPQLTHRRHYDHIDHPEMGWAPYEAPSYRFSKVELKRRRPPLLGEHTEYVCREILGMTDEEFVTLLAEGVFE